MTEFNKFSMYSRGFETLTGSEVDTIDRHIDFLKQKDNYDEVKKYLSANFGYFEGGKWFEYPDLHKSLYIFMDDNKLEFCAQKNHKDYYGKGWIKYKEE